MPPPVTVHGHGAREPARRLQDRRNTGPRHTEAGDPFASSSEPHRPASLTGTYTCVRSNTSSPKERAT